MSFTPKYPAGAEPPANPKTEEGAARKEERRLARARREEERRLDARLSEPGEYVGDQDDNPVIYQDARLTIYSAYLGG